MSARYSTGYWPEDDPDRVSPILPGDPIDEVEDDDPRCVCGVYRSEHAAMGCPEGFQTPEQWEAERSLIRNMARREASGEIDPGWEWWNNDR